MRREVLLTILAVVMCSLGVSAQRVAAIKNQLSANSTSGASVTITEDSSITAAVQYVENRNGSLSKLQGYSFVIYHASGQFANEGASKVLNTFRNTFKSVESSLEVDSPTFKVVVGKCINMEEAAILFHKLEDMYPDAVRSETEVPIRLLTRHQGYNKMVIETLGTVVDDKEIPAANDQESVVIETPEDIVSLEATIKVEGIDAENLENEEVKISADL